MLLAVLILAFLLFLLVGVPVAFAIGFVSVIFIFQQGGLPLESMPHRMTNALSSFVLLALPAFLLAGRMFNTAGITDRIFEFAISLVGRVRGGLAQSNALASMMFASMSGTAIGDAGGLGAVVIRMMKRAGYRPAFAAGITSASSVLGPIIPPSVAMVILGATAQISIGRLFIAGVIPGLLMTAGLMSYLYLYAHLTEEGQSWPVHRRSFKQLINDFSKAVFPLLTPVIIIGSIVAGLVTPTEAAVLAIAYAILLGILYRELTWKNLWQTLEETVITTGVFMFIFATAAVFGWILTLQGTPQLLANFMFSLTSDPMLIMFLISAFLVLVGMFLDTVAAILLVIPVMVPIANQAGLDPIHFAIVALVSLIIGIITPPFGIVLFVVSDVAKTPVLEVTKAALPYLVPMLIVVILLILFPPISTYLPALFFD